MIAFITDLSSEFGKFYGYEIMVPVDKATPEVVSALIADGYDFMDYVDGSSFRGGETGTEYEYWGKQVEK